METYEYKSNWIHQTMFVFGLLCGVVLLGTIISLFSSHKAYAALDYVNTYNAGTNTVVPYNLSIPPTVQNTANFGCLATGNAIAQVQWLSLPGQPLVQGTNPVQSGSPQTLQWNVGGYYCYPNGTNKNGTPQLALASNSIAIGVSDSLGSSTFSSLVPNQLQIPYDGVHAWSVNQTIFTYVVPSLPLGVNTVTVTDNNQAINRFNTVNPSFIYQCVGSPTNPPFTQAQVDAFNLNRGSLTNFTTPNVCPAIPASMDFTFNIVPAPSYTCTGASFSSGSSFSPNQPFSATANVTVNNVPNPQTAGYTMNMQVTEGGVFVTNGNAVGVPINFTGNTGTAQVGNLAAPSLGTVIMTWQLIGPGNVVLQSCGNSANSPPPTLNVSFYPYMKIYGGDVSAGEGFVDSTSATPTTCTTDTISQGITGYNVGTQPPPNPNFSGAGTEFGAQTVYDPTNANANGNIIGFATQQGSGIWSGLSFANTLPQGNNFYGGNFVSGGSTLDDPGVSCATDFYGTNPGGAVAAPAGTLDISSLGSTISNFNTNATIQESSPLTTAQQPVIFVKGDVYITNNITYATSGWSVGNVPSFKLIVQGNIYIDHNVSQLDGLYVAQPTSTGGGTIYDCSNGFSQTPVDTTFYDNCHNQLIVNGAFVANQVKYSRTIGNVGDSANDNTPAGGCMIPGAATCSTKAAEIFNYSPELWLDNITSTTVTGPVKYDSITSLPPVL